MGSLGSQHGCLASSEQPEISLQKKKNNKLANTQETVAKAGLWPPIHPQTCVHPHPYENTRAAQLKTSTVNWGLGV